ncbi:MAG: alpha-2-macroglobulin family protein, partial [Chloroflexota bacterium]
PSTSKLEVKAPVTARPGQKIELNLSANSPASIYLLVRDSRLTGSGPQERLAASLKGGLEGASDWGNLGYLTQTLDNHPDWPKGFDRYRDSYGGAVVYSAMPVPMMPQTMPARPGGGLLKRMGPADMLSNVADAAGAVMKSGPMKMKRELESAIVEDLLLEPSEPEAAGPAPRKDFADVAYCAVIQTDAQGEATVAFQLPEAITSYSIEAFALSRDGAEWSTTRESLEVSQPLWAEFKLPAFVYPGDRSPATLEVGCKGEQFRLRLWCDGVAVPFTLSGANQTAPDTFTGHRAKITFEAYPGLWRAELEDLVTHEKDLTERTVEAIGQFKALARRFQLLLTGETLSLSVTGALQMRLLPSLDKPFNVLCDATTNYDHRCCEQTAAKLIAAVAALMAGGDQHKLRDVIVAGAEREKLMHLPGRGFMMYPPQESGGNTSPNDYWGKRAAEHLSSVALIGQPLFADGATSYDPTIVQALRQVVEMGLDAAKAYRIEMQPSKIENGRDAYRAVARQAASKSDALIYAQRTLKSFADNKTPAPGGAVLAREEQAYCAAALLTGGDQTNLGLAIEATNRLASSLDGEGRLYSTVDSVALISLMAALRVAGIGVGGKGSSLVRLDGQEMPLTQALEVAGAGQTSEITVWEGVALVELTSEISEDWNTFRAELPVAIQLARPGKLNLRPLRVGDTLELVVKLEQYEPGLLAQVCLPSALSRIEGGGEVKKFSVDFSGRTEVRLPLRATGHTLAGGEHWAILVRNMFKEEQAGNPGLQLIRVSAD